MTEHDTNANADRLREEAKAKLSKDREARTSKAGEPDKRRPTPTQEETDLAALGFHVNDKQDDGGGPDPYATRVLHPEGGAALSRTRTMHPKETGEGYTTR